MPHSSCEQCFYGEEFLTDKTNKDKIKEPAFSGEPI